MVWDIEFINHFFKMKKNIGFYEIEYNTRKKGKSKISATTPIKMLIDLIKLRFLNY
jgi:hypothetical protein